MLGRYKGHHDNQWVNTSPTTPLPGLSTSGEVLLTDSDVIYRVKFPPMYRDLGGVSFMKCGIEKVMDRCACSIKW